MCGCFDRRWDVSKPSNPAVTPAPAEREPKPVGLKLPPDYSGLSVAAISRVSHCGSGGAVDLQRESGPDSGGGGDADLVAYRRSQMIEVSAVRWRGDRTPVSEIEHLLLLGD